MNKEKIVFLIVIFTTFFATGCGDMSNVTSTLFDVNIDIKQKADVYVGEDTYVSTDTNESHDIVEDVFTGEDVGEEDVSSDPCTYIDWIIPGTKYQCGSNECTMEMFPENGECTAKCIPSFYLHTKKLRHLEGFTFQYYKAPIDKWLTCEPK